MTKVRIFRNGVWIEEDEEVWLERMYPDTTGFAARNAQNTDQILLPFTPSGTTMSPVIVPKLPDFDITKLGTNDLKASPLQYTGLTERIQRKDGILDPYLYDLLVTATSKGEEKRIHGFMKGYIKKPLESDAYGNLWCIVGDDLSPQVMFSCHMDTVHPKPFNLLLFKTAIAGNAEASDFVFAGRMGKDAGSKNAKMYTTCLGADDKVGIYIMSKMINAKIPGLYMFHMGEESSCEGSKNVVKHLFDKATRFKNIKKAIAFDRKGYGDVITHQSGRCCSDEFANALAKALNTGLTQTLGNNRGPRYTYTPCTGVYTDTAEYKEEVPECSNLSVGYFSQHCPWEHFDPIWLECAFIPAAMKVDWNALPAKRDPKEQPVYQNYGHHYSTNEYYSDLAAFDFSKAIKYSEVTGTTTEKETPIFPVDVKTFFEPGNMPTSLTALEKILQKTTRCVRTFSTYSDGPKIIWELMQLKVDGDAKFKKLVTMLKESASEGKATLPDWFSTLLEVQPKKEADAEDPFDKASEIAKKKLCIQNKNTPSSFRDRYEALSFRLDQMEEDVEALADLDLIDVDTTVRFEGLIETALLDISQLEEAVTEYVTILLKGNKNFNVTTVSAWENNAKYSVNLLGKLLYNAESGMFSDPTVRDAVDVHLGYNFDDTTARAEDDNEVDEFYEPSADMNDIVDEAVQELNAIPKKPTTIEEMEAYIQEGMAKIQCDNRMTLADFKTALTEVFARLGKARRFDGLAGNTKGVPDRMNIWISRSMKERNAAVELYERSVAGPLTRMDSNDIDPELRKVISDWGNAYVFPIKLLLEDNNKGVMQ